MGGADESYRSEILLAADLVLFAVQSLLVFAIELPLLYLMIGKWQEGTFEIGNLCFRRCC